MFGVLLAAFATLPLVPRGVSAEPRRAQERPPRVVRVLQSDSLVVDSLVWGEGRSVWPYQIVQVAPHEDTWVRLRDPFGGEFLGPSPLVATFGEEAVAYAQGRESRSVLFLPKPVGAAITALFLVGALTLLVLPFTWYRRRYLRERDHRRRTDQMRRQMSEGREAERLHLAQELHDGPVQDLHTLRLRLSLLERSVEAEGRSEVGGALGEVIEDVQRVILDVRGVSEALRPPALGPFGFSAALFAFKARYTDIHPGIDVDLDLDEDRQQLPESVRLALFRISQEAMNNAAKHARPERVGIRFRLTDDAATLVVEDDGGGYDVQAALALPESTTTSPRRYGLLGMSERAEAIGADLRITSDPVGGGTRIEVHVPRPFVAPSLVPLLSPVS